MTKNVSHLEVFSKKNLLKNEKKSTGKHICCSLRLIETFEEQASCHYIQERIA